MIKKFALPKSVAGMFGMFKEFGYELYLVGGCVRDLIMNKHPHDYDFATNATPDQMKEIAATRGITLLPTGEQYGTMTFHCTDGDYEVTTYRQDGNYSDGRRPDNVVFSTSIQDDLSRRDFTMNAIAYSPEEGLIDPFKGERDIQRGVIRAVGNPNERFNEDALRIMRALRFAYKLNFIIEYHTDIAIQEGMAKLVNVSNERVNKELIQILQFYRPVFMQSYLLDKLLVFLFPKGKSYFPLGRFQFAGLHTIAEKLVYLSLMAERDKKVPLAITTDDLKRLKFSNTIVTNFAVLLQAVQAEEPQTLYDVKEAMFNVGVDAFTSALSVWAAVGFHPVTKEAFVIPLGAVGSYVQTILSREEPWRLQDLAVNGTHLVKLGITGPENGKILKELLIDVWKKPTHNTAEYLLTKAKMIAGR